MRAQAAGWFTGHGLHAVTILGPMVLIALVAVGADLRAWRRRRSDQQPSTGRVTTLLPPMTGTVVLAATLSAAAALVHTVVCPAHFREATIYGLFFAVTATLQLGWAALALARRTRGLWVLGVVGNLTLVALWMVTRTVGVPVGPGAGEVEAIGALDVMASVAELGVVVACAVLLSRAAQRERRPVARLSCRLASASSSSFSPSASVRRIMRNS